MTMWIKWLGKVWILLTLIQILIRHFYPKIATNSFGSAKKCLLKMWWNLRPKNYGNILLVIAVIVITELDCNHSSAPLTGQDGYRVTQSWIR
jgi:hypothetical protein